MGRTDAECAERTHRLPGGLEVTATYADGSTRVVDNAKLHFSAIPAKAGTQTETLTTQQLNYLKALIAGEKAISSTEVMHRYQISSTTSISRSKIAFIKNDILDNKAGDISFQDPIYAYWLKSEYFAK